MSRGLGLTAPWAFKLRFGGRMIGGGVGRDDFATASSFRDQVFCSALGGGKQTLKMDENSLTHNPREKTRERRTGNNEQDNS